MTWHLSEWSMGISLICLILARFDSAIYDFRTEVMSLVCGVWCVFCIILVCCGTAVSIRYWYWTGHNCACDWLVSAVKVPLLDEMSTSSVGIRWLKYLEKKRIQLLQLVSDQQFTITRSYTKSNLASSVKLFPLYDVLEHRYCHKDR
jgi:hypothetical protein